MESTTGAPTLAALSPPNTMGNETRSTRMMIPARQTAAKFFRYPTPICLVSSSETRASGMGLNAAMM